jgi:hypothetical protein
MNLLFFFMDGLGLGSNDPETNPLVRANMPVLFSLLNGGRLVSDTIPFEGDRATLLALDACLNIRSGRSPLWTQAKPGNYRHREIQKPFFGS